MISPSIEYHLLSPALIVFAVAVAGVLVEAFLPRRTRYRTHLTLSLAGLLAASAAVAVGWGLATWVFVFHWSPPWWVPFAGAASGAGLALAAGWWSLHELLARPVMETLRRAAQ